MTIQETHIAIGLGVQNMNFNMYDFFLREEIDFYYNKNTIKFIRERVNPKSNVKHEGFEETQKRYEDVEELITPLRLPMYIDTTDSNCFYSIMPSNFLSLCNDRTEMYYDCRGTHTITSSVSNYYGVWTFLDDSGSPLYGDLVIDFKIGGTTVYSFNFATIFATYRPTGLYSLLEKFFIVNQVIYEMNRRSLGITVYWEKYDNIYQPNSFIFVRTVDNTATVVISCTGVTGSPVTVTVNTTIARSISVPTVSPYSTVESVDRLTKSDIYPNLLKHSYYKTKWDSPISRMSRGKVYVHNDNTFTPINLRIDYIRRPLPVNYYLGQSCELNANFHQEIVDLTVQEIKAIIDSKNYKNIINENLLSE